MKWLPVVVLAVIGVVAGFVCIEYLTVSIHQLPGYIPGNRPVNGHYHLRGAIAGFIALVALVGAAIMTVRIARPKSEAPKVAATPEVPLSTDQLLAGSQAEPETHDAG
jgi:hypothetical protein